MEFDKAKFMEKLKELVAYGKKKKSVLEYQEINDFFRDLPLVALQTFQQTVELPPISIQSDSKKSDFHVFLFVFKK